MCGQRRGRGLGLAGVARGARSLPSPDGRAPRGPTARDQPQSGRRTAPPGTTSPPPALPASACSERCPRRARAMANGWPPGLFFEADVQPLNSHSVEALSSLGVEAGEAAEWQKAWTVPLSVDALACAPLTSPALAGSGDHVGVDLRLRRVPLVRPGFRAAITWGSGADSAAGTSAASARGARGTSLLGQPLGDGVAHLHQHRRDAHDACSLAAASPCILCKA